MVLEVNSGSAKKPAILHSAASGRIASKPFVPPRNLDVNFLRGKNLCILSDDAPLLSLITIMASIFSTGNSNIIVPGQKTSLIATELYQVFETSDIPSGYVNILTSKENELNKTLSQHENIDGIWYFGKNSDEKSSIIKNTTSNLKRYWSPEEKNIDWSMNSESFLNEFLFQSTQVKNIWIPYGE